MLPSVYITRVNRKSVACILAAIGLLFLTAEATASGKPSDAELAAITERGAGSAEVAVVGLPLRFLT
jgi:hypothetical protein